MSITIENFNKLVNKSKNKKDGVYLMKPYTYVVKDGNFIAYSDYSGNCYRCLYGFTTFIGKVERYDIRRKLNDFLKNQ